MWRYRCTIFIIQTVVLCSCLTLLLASMIPADQTSAEIGKFGFVVYIVSERIAPEIESRCLLTRYNCTTPHGLCSDDHDKYQLEYVNKPDYVEGPHTNWLCRITIKSMGLDDIGPYSMCIRPSIDQNRYSDCISKDHVYLAAWERDEHGHICQISYDEDSAGLLNNCTAALTTQLTTTENPELPSSTHNVLSTKSSKFSVNVSAIKAEHAEEETKGTSACYSSRDIILAAVGGFIAALVLVSVIWTIHRVRKRRREKQYGSEGYIQGSLVRATHPVTKDHTIHDDIVHDIDHEAEEPA